MCRHFWTSVKSRTNSVVNIKAPKKDYKDKRTVLDNNNNNNNEELNHKNKNANNLDFEG